MGAQKRVPSTSPVGRANQASFSPNRHLTHFPTFSIPSLPSQDYFSWLRHVPRSCINSTPRHRALISNLPAGLSRSVHASSETCARTWESWGRCRRRNPDILGDFCLEGRNFVTEKSGHGHGFRFGCRLKTIGKKIRPSDHTFIGPPARHPGDNPDALHASCLYFWTLHRNQKRGSFTLPSLY